MNLSAPPADRVALRLTPTTAVLAALAALAWAVTIARAHALGNGPGTMGMAFAAFLLMWTLMMTAMMLPAVTPLASLYAQTIRQHRSTRVPLFVAGYLLAWALVGLPAYLLLREVDHVAGDSYTALRTVAVGVLIAAGIYQLTPLKTRCLRHCRSPLAQLLHYGNFKGRTRDLRVASHHAFYCVGCCWALMGLFVVFGVMNIWAMVGLAAVVLAEKVGRRGVAFARIVGVACLALAVLVVVSPTIAHAVVPTTGPTGMTTKM